MRLRALEATLGTSLDSVRARLGAEVVDVVPVSTLRAPDWVRGASRLTLSDGRSVKLRRVRDVEEAARIARMLGELAEPRLARVLFQDGRVLLEEWIDGVPLLEAGVAEGDLVEAGSLLGHLHARPSLADEAFPRVVSTAADVARVAAYLADLVRAGAVAASAAETLSVAVRALDPGTTEAGVCHGDLCAENMVLDERGRLRVVDNEGVCVGPLDLDLATTLYRWPLGPRELETFLAAYAERRDPRAAIENGTFWRIAAVVKSAHVRVVRVARGANVPLAELDRLLAGIESRASRAAAP